MGFWKDNLREFLKKACIKFGEKIQIRRTPDEILAITPERTLKPLSIHWGIETEISEGANKGALEMMKELLE